MGKAVTVTMVPDLDRVPAQLRARPQWVCWREEGRAGKSTKIPFGPKTGRRASTTDPGTWATFEDAVAALRAENSVYDGVGYVFEKDDPYTGIDFDDCIGADGHVVSEAQAIVDELDSYAETSPSGRGVKVWVRATKPGQRCKAAAEGFKQIEIYDQKRFFAVTGRHLAGTPATIEAHQDELTALCEKYLGKKGAPNNAPTQLSAGFPAVGSGDRTNAVDRCKRYLTKCPDAISGDNGHDKTLRAACECYRFGLADGEAREVMEWFNSGKTGDEQWAAKELDHKLDSAKRLVDAAGDFGVRLGPRGGNGVGSNAANSSAVATDTDALVAMLIAGDASEIFDSSATLAHLSRADYGRVKSQLRAHFGRRLSVRDLDAAVKEVRRQGRVERPNASGAVRLLPEIVVNGRPMAEVVTDAVAALESANTPPVVFCRSGALARVRADETGRPLIEPLDVAKLRNRLARVARWVVVREDGRTDIPPPKHIVEDVLALGGWPFPALEGVVEQPVLRPDGTILDTPGYDAATRLVYLPAPGLRIPSIPANPNADELMAAVTLIDEALEGFPFADAASRANAVAGLLTPLIRHFINGRAPLELINAPQPGSGKGLLAELGAVIATGRAAALMAAAKDDEEWRKRITAVLARGVTLIIIDNVEGRLEAPSLSMVLTADTWQDRILGRSEAVSLPQRATWAATGNNIQLGGDLPRRCYWVHLDAKVARPWLRTGFRHPDLSGWARGRRGDLIAALLVLARAWIVAGRPQASLPVVGGFDSWANAIGGILAHAGVDGFLGNQNTMYDQADTDAAEWQAFLAGWREVYGDKPHAVAGLAKDIRAGVSLRELLPGDLAEALAGAGSFERRLGRALAKREKVRHGDEQLRLERRGVGRSGRPSWVVDAS